MSNSINNTQPPKNTIQNYDALISSKNLNNFKLSKSGDLVKKTAIDKFKEFFSEGSRKENKDKIKAEITEILDKIKNSSIDERSKIRKMTRVIKKIVDLKDEKFVVELKIKGYISQSVENRLSNRLRGLTGSQKSLGKLRKEKTRAANPQEREQIKLAIRIEKCKLGKALGIKFEANKGATGTVLARNLKGTPFAVFKPTHPHTPVITRIKNYFKRTYGGQLSYLSHKSDAQSKAEVAAFELDKHFGFGITPSSAFTKVGKKEGAFQSFVKPDKKMKSEDEKGSDIEYREAAGFIKHPELRSKSKETKLKDGSKEVTSDASMELTSFKEEQLDAFQKMAIFDYLLGNLDRHDENWFVKSYKIPEESTKETSTFETDFTDIKVIDNANAFLCKNPAAAGKIRNQYAWRELKIAGEPLTEETKKLIKGITKDKLKGFIQKMNDPKSLGKDLGNFLTKEMIEELENRVAVLQHLVTQEKASPLMLAGVVSDKERKKFLKT